MKRLPFLICLMAILILINSCKNGHTGLLIPKDATLVVEINNSSIISKLSWKEIQQSSWYKDAYNNTDDSISKKLLNNPESSGIDIKSNFALFSKKQNNNSYFAIEGHLTDPSAFESFVKKETNVTESKNDGDIKYINSKTDHVITWSGNTFIIMSNAPSINNNNFPTATNNIVSSDSLRIYAKDLYNLKSDQSIESDDHFTSLIKEGGDIHIFLNNSQYYSSLSGGMLDMLKANTLLEGNVSTFTLNFEDGKILVKTNQFYGPGLKAIFEKYSFKNVTDDQLKRIPSNNVVAALVFNFPPEIIKDILKAAGVDGLANAYLGKMNYSLDELVSAFKGQFVFSFSNFNIHQEQQTIEGSNSTFNIPKTDYNIIFGTTINNKPAFDKLLGIITKEIPEDQSKINFRSLNDWFAISNSKASTDTFLAGGSGKAPFIDLISGHPFGMYIDIQKIIQGVGPMATDSTSQKIAAISMNMWQNIVVTGGDYKNGVATAEFVVNLVDKSTNSLKQINRYSDQIHSLEKLRPKPQYDVTDSTVSVPMLRQDSTISTQ